MRKGETGFANVARRCQSSYTEFHSRSIGICIYYYLFYHLTCSNQSYPGASTQTRLIKSGCRFLFSFSFFSFLSCIINYWLVLTLWSYLCLAFLFFHCMELGANKKKIDKILLQINLDEISSSLHELSKKKNDNYLHVVLF